MKVHLCLREITTLATVSNPQGFRHFLDWDVEPDRKADEPDLLLG